MTENWLVELTCCGRDDGNYFTHSWADADAARECYTSGTTARPYGRPDLRGHERSGVVKRLPDV